MIDEFLEDFCAADYDSAFESASYERRQIKNKHGIRRKNAVYAGKRKYNIMKNRCALFYCFRYDVLFPDHEDEALYNDSGYFDILRKGELSKAKFRIKKHNQKCRKIARKISVSKIRTINKNDLYKIGITSDDDGNISYFGGSHGGKRSLVHRSFNLERTVS